MSYFFFDRCMDLYIVRALAQLDRINRIIHQEDDGRFGHKAADIKIIAQLGREHPKPVFITVDEAMKKEPDERAALADSGMTVVFFKSGWHDIDFHDRAWMLIRLWPTLVKETIRVRAPTAFEVPASLRKLDRLCLTSELKR